MSNGMWNNAFTRKSYTLYEVLPNTLDTMRPMHRQNLNLLLPKVYEGMRLQENTLYDLWPWPWVKVTQNVTQYPRNHLTYAQQELEDATSKRLWGDAFTKKIHYLTFDIDLEDKVTRNVTQYPLHHVIYASTKFEVATSNGLGEDTITRNVRDGQTDRRTDAGTDEWTTNRLWYEIKIPYFSNEKAGIIIDKCMHCVYKKLWNRINTCMVRKRWV